MLKTIQKPIIKYSLFLLAALICFDAKAYSQDTIVDSRFKVLQAVDCSNLAREKGKWYTAVPPLSRCRTGLTPADYFGRTLVQNLPKDVRVGVINVSVAGCKIELFEKDSFQEYAAE